MNNNESTGSLIKGKLQKKRKNEKEKMNEKNEKKK